jgi:Tfp pilus assembly protein PilF
MNTRLRMLLILLVIVLCAVACTATREKQKKQAAAYRELAEAYFVERQYTLALQELIKAEKLNPDSALIHNSLGLVYMMKDRMDLSIKHFKRAIAIKPDYAEANNNLATALLRIEEWDEAIDHLERLNTSLMYATPQYALLNLGWAYFNKKEYDQAEKYYKLAIKHYDDGFPKDIAYIKALGGLGRTYIATNKIAQALSYLGRAAKEAPRVPDTYFYMGQAYEKAGRKKDAKMAYMKVVEVAPDSEIANQAARAALKLP